MTPADCHVFVILSSCNHDFVFDSRLSQLCDSFAQVVRMHVRLSTSNIISYLPKDGDALLWQNDGRSGVTLDVINRLSGILSMRDSVTMSYINSHLPYHTIPIHWLSGLRERDESYLYLYLYDNLFT